MIIGQNGERIVVILLYVYIVLIVLNLIKRRSKILFLGLLAFLWILVGWSEGTADWHIYVMRFEEYESVSARTEMVFTFLMRFGHWLNFDYRMMYVFLTAVCFLLIGKTIIDYSKDPGFVLALYAIFSFPIDATQIRFFIAFSIVFFAFRYILNYLKNKQKRYIIMWLIAFLIAVNVHMSVIVFLVILIPVFFGRKVTIIFTLAANALMIFFSSLKTRVFEMIVSFLGNEKAEIVQNQSSQYGMRTIMFVWMKILTIFLGFVMFYIYIKYFSKRLRSNGVNREPTGSILTINYEKCLDLNIAVLSIIGLIMVTADFYRIQQIIIMLNYMVYASYLSTTKTMKLNINNLIIIVLSVVFAFIALYNLVLSSTNYYSVFVPLFENNQLFNNIMI